MKIADFNNIKRDVKLGLNISEEMRDRLKEASAETWLPMSKLMSLYIYKSLENFYKKKPKNAPKLPKKRNIKTVVYVSKEAKDKLDGIASRQWMSTSVLATMFILENLNNHNADDYEKKAVTTNTQIINFMKYKGDTCCGNCGAELTEEQVKHTNSLFGISTCVDCGRLSLDDTLVKNLSSDNVLDWGFYV